MLGAVIGDMVGSVYEFNNTKRTEFPLFTAQSIFTDDSIMTIAVADWLMSDHTHSEANLESIMARYAYAFPHPMGGYGGNFSQWLFGPGPRRPYGSWGNGSAMRVSAVGWMFSTLEETLDAAKKSASITHNHPEGIKGAQATAAAIFLARTGRTKDEIMRYITDTFHYDLSRHTDEIRRTYGWDESCQGTVPPAIRAFIDSTDFESAIRMAVSLGGDSDTLACITGAIAEAYYDSIPQWIVETAWDRIPTQFQDIILNLQKATDYRIRTQF